MNRLALVLTVLSADAWMAPSRRTVSRHRTIRHESFGLPGAEDPNENTPKEILGEYRYKKEFVADVKEDSLLLKEGKHVHACARVAPARGASLARCTPSQVLAASLPQRKVSSQIRMPRGRRRKVLRAL